MRTLIVADVHANLAAFEAVLAAATQKGPLDAIWCLGDIVGYGPSPRECIQLLRGYPHVMVAGNHDLGAIGAISVHDFNSLAREAVLWSSSKLTQEEREWLAGLPLVAIQEEVTLVHGSLRDPVWDYLVSPDVAAAHLQAQSTSLGFVGHSHLPLLFQEQEGRVHGRYLADGERLDASKGRLVANPGSAGQPRDGDSRAAFALFDGEDGVISFHRVEYDIAQTQRLMLAEGLPLPLAERLAYGR